MQGTGYKDVERAEEQKRLGWNGQDVKLLPWHGLEPMRMAELLQRSSLPR